MLCRFRIVNESNARFFRRLFGDAASRHTCDMYIIGSDRGLLPAPVHANRINLAPAERTDVLQELTAYAGQGLILRSDSFDILQIRVARAPASRSRLIPSVLRPVQRIAESEAVRTRRLTLNKKMDKVQNSMEMTLNDTPWHMPVTETPVVDTTEIWAIVNLTRIRIPYTCTWYGFRFSIAGRSRRPLLVQEVLPRQRARANF